MRVIAKKTLREFWERHADARGPLEAWHAEATHADWKSPNDIEARYASASFVPTDRVGFNIKGNQYRLIVHVRYDVGIVFIRFIGTHAENDEIDASTV